MKSELSNLKNDNGRVTYSYKMFYGTSLYDAGNNGVTIVKDGKIVFDDSEGAAPK
jgi:hypothetical protein